MTESKTQAKILKLLRKEKMDLCQIVHMLSKDDPGVSVGMIRRLTWNMADKHLIFFNLDRKWQIDGGGCNNGSQVPKM
jgi:hypothetical protein